MHFLKRYLLGVFLVLCILSGCTDRRGQETAPTAYRVVSNIKITRQNGLVTVERAYEDQEEMQQILNYLRWVDPYGAPEEDPMTQQGEEFQVQLQYSDGTTKIYHQRCNRYLRVGDGPWKKIDPERGRELSRIFGALEGEGSLAPPNTGPTQPLLRPKLEYG